MCIYLPGDGALVLGFQGRRDAAVPVAAPRPRAKLWSQGKDPPLQKSIHPHDERVPDLRLPRSTGEATPCRPIPPMRCPHCSHDLCPTLFADQCGIDIVDATLQRSHA